MLFRPADRLARINYAYRSSSFAYSFLVLGLLFVERHFSPWVLAFGALQFLLYPHLAYLHTRLADDSRQAEVNNLLLDAFLLGAWMAQLGYALWPACGMLAAVSLNNATTGGFPRMMIGWRCLIAGAVLWGAIIGFPLQPHTGVVTSAACLIGIIAYVSIVGTIMFRQNQRLREALRASEERFRYIAEHAGGMVATLDAEGRWLYASPSFHTHFNEADLRVGSEAFGLVRADDRVSVRMAFDRMVITGQGEQLRFRMTAKDGRTLTVECESNPMGDIPGRVNMVIMVMHDVTEQIRASIDLRLAAHAFDSLVDGVLISEADGRIDYVNQAFTIITGYLPTGVIGFNINDLKSGLQPDDFYNKIRDSIEQSGSWQGRMWQRRKNGTMFVAWVSVSAVKGEDGVTSHFVWILHESTPDYRAKKP